MLTLQRLLSLPVFLSSTIIAHALARSPPSIILQRQNEQPTGGAPQLTGGEDCNNEQMQRIRDGFTEMNQLFQAALDIDWEDDPEREFFGNPDRIANYTSLIEQNLFRAAQYGNASTEMQLPDIHVRCDDPNDFCDEGNRREGRHMIYNIANEPHLNFCRRYFGLDPLDKTLENVAGNLTMNMAIMSYYNRATAWARQLMHISSIGIAIKQTMESDPPTQNSTTGERTETIRTFNTPMNTSFIAGVMNEQDDDDGPFNAQSLKYAYGATRVKLVAGLSTQEPYDAANNAEGYALYAQAKYVIAKKDFYPNMPVIDFDNEASVLANNMLQEGERPRYACFDEMDVVPKGRRTESIGKPIQSSGSSMFGRGPQWPGCARVATCWAVLCVFIPLGLV